MRAEVERAYQEGGDIKPEHVAANMLQQMKKRVVGRQAVIDPSGVVSFIGEDPATPTPMSKWELNRRARTADPENLEAEAIERSFEAGGEGGRIEVYAGGAM